MNEGKKMVVLMNHLRERAKGEEPFEVKAERWAKFSKVALILSIVASVTTVVTLEAVSRK